jgi:hypothetical protein
MRTQRRAGIPLHRPPPPEVAQKHDKNNRPRGLLAPPRRPLPRQGPTRPHLRPAPQDPATWSIVSAFKGLENDFAILAGLTDIDDDWYRGMAYVGMSRARTRLHVIIHPQRPKSFV